MCLTEKYSRVWGSKNLPDVFPIRNGLIQDALLPILPNFALEYYFRKIQVNQDGLTFNVHITFCLC
jgi:hypothetical protein